MNLLLPLLILLPLVGGVMMLILGKSPALSIARFGVVIALIVLVIALFMGLQFLNASANSSLPIIAPQFEFAPRELTWQLPISVLGKPIQWQFQLGADGIGIAMVVLTAIVTFSASLISLRIVQTSPGQYVALMLLVEACAIGAFLAMDLLTFYIFFEAILLPVVWMVFGWGIPEQRALAGRKFLLYTLAGSIPLVVGLVGLAFQPFVLNEPSTISLIELSNRAALQAKLESLGASDTAIAKDEHDLEPWFNRRPPALENGKASIAQNQSWIFWLLVLGFGIKTAVLPLHSWLPTTYRAAHPTTTAILAAIVLKLGLFGFLRIVLPILPIPSHHFFQPVFGVLGAAAVVYGGLAALGQRSLRGLLAYSSLSHVGFIILGIAALNVEGIGGATLQMVNHGLITGAMFLLCGMLEFRYGPSSFAEMERGLAEKLPRFSLLFIFFVLAGAGMPGLNGFVGELMTLVGMVKVSPWLTAIAALGIVLGAWYGLRAVQQLLFGPGKDERKETINDVEVLEGLALIPLVIICLWIGLGPQRPLGIIRRDVSALANLYIGFNEDRNSMPPMNQQAVVTTIAEGDGN